MSIDTARQKLVHNKFVNRWVDRYEEICSKYGSEAGRKWANSFLNKDDTDLIRDELRKRP